MTQRAPVKYYQVGSFAVGNRLLPSDLRTVQSDPARANSLTSGHRACQGCGEALAVRTVTTEAIGPWPGNPFGQGKDVPAIVIAHRIPYVATATVADLHDLERKVERAMAWHGARTSTSWPPARSDGGASRRTRCGWPVWRTSPASSPSRRPCTAR